MRKTITVALLGLAALLGPACGKKGPILPPLVLVPQSVESVKAFQQGSRIVLEWMNPKAFIDGRPLAGIDEVEIWLEERQDKTAPSPAGDFLSRARRIAAAKPAVPGSSMRFGYDLPSAGWADRTFVFAFRVKDSGKRRLSEFSDQVGIRPQALALPPTRLLAEVFADRIALSWERPTSNIDGSTPALVKGYHVYRIDKGGLYQRLTAAPGPGMSFNDMSFVFKQPYRYVVRAAGSATEPFLESDDSAAVEVLPLDVFPPAAPKGLTAGRGADFITLVWDANAEADTAGYKVWRRDEGRPDFVLLTPKAIPETTFTDRAVEKGKRYDYSISVVDAAGNEGPKSAAVSETVKDPRP